MSLRILVADDYKMVRTAVSQLIRNSHEDWKVCWEAEDGQAAVEKAVEAKPDLVILDLRMPRRDGMSAGREIRARLPNVLILIFTLMDSPQLEQEAAAAGFQGVVQKTEATSLISAIRNALSPGTAAQAGQESRPNGKSANRSQFHNLRRN
jgi:DNA-binding NarL/FixJ family response regulator